MIRKFIAAAFSLLGILTVFLAGVEPRPALAGGITITCTNGGCPNCTPMTVNGINGVFCYCGSC